MSGEVTLDLPNAVQTKINACGPAALKPVICALTPHCPTVSEIPWSDETFTSLSEMLDIGAYYGLELTWKRPIAVLWIREQITKGVPVTALVRYSIINPPHDFDGNHWVTVRGFDENRFLINDPLRVDPVWVPDTTLEQAMTQTLGSAAQFLTVYPTRGLSMYKPGVTIDMTHANQFAHPAPALMPGMKYVRVVFDVSRESGSTNLGAAFALYDDYLTQLDAAGITPILILNQETFGEKAGYPPYHQMTDAQFRDLFNKLTDMSGQIAAHYTGRGYIYQIWNQQDAPREFEDSVGIKPQLYGEFYRQMKQRIKAADPGCKVITGGFLDGAGAIIAYFNAANLSTVAIDGIAVHPYGQAPRAYPEFKVWGFIEDYINLLRSGISAPIWITEHGILNHPNVPPDKLIRHASEFTKAVSPFVTALIWYPVVDGMHNGSGVLFNDGTPKRDAVGNTIFTALQGEVETPTELEVFRLEGAALLNLRVSPSTSAAIIDKIADLRVVKRTGRTASANGYPWVEIFTDVDETQRKCWFASRGQDWSTRIEILRVAEVIEL